jgi:hypothetical protein
MKSVLSVLSLGLWFTSLNVKYPTSAISSRSSPK